MDSRVKKTEIKDSVLEVLKVNGSGDWKTMIASYSLETGFNKNTIEEVLKDMIQVKLIRVDVGIVTLINKTDPSKPLENPNL